MTMNETDADASPCQPVTRHFVVAGFDQEIDTMQVMSTLFNDMDLVTSARILRWATERWGV